MEVKFELHACENEDNADSQVDFEDDQDLFMDLEKRSNESEDELTPELEPEDSKPAQVQLEEVIQATSIEIEVPD